MYMAEPNSTESGKMVSHVVRFGPDVVDPKKLLEQVETGGINGIIAEVTLALLRFKKIGGFLELTGEGRQKDGQKGSLDEIVEILDKAEHISSTDNGFADVSLALNGLITQTRVRCGELKKYIKKNMAGEKEMPSMVKYVSEEKLVIKRNLEIIKMMFVTILQGT